MDVNMNSTNLPMSETSHTLASLRKLALCDDKNQEVELSDEEKRQKSCCLWSSCLKEVEKRHVITFMDVQSICRMDTCMSGSSSWKEALSSTRSPALSKWTEYSNVDDFKGLRWCMSRNIFLDNVKLGKIVEDNVKGSLLPTQVVKQFGWLCQHQQSDVACLLLSAKSVDANRTLGGASLLHIASAEGLENVVGVLVAQGAKLGKVAKDGATPLVSAVQRQHYSVAHMLVMAGSDVNKADKTRRSPLHYAACAASPRIVAMLLLHGAEIDSMDNEGSTPIITACQYSTDTDVGSESVVQLVAAGSDVNRPRKDGYTALALACKAGSLGATTCLLEQGAEVHSTLPMYVASQEGHLKCVLALLHAGAPSDRALADTGATPLSAAAENGHADIVQALLHVGASVDKVNPVTAYAPMHLACLGGHVTVVEALLDAGAHLNLRGGKHSARGVTPLGCALSKKCNAVITLLRARGAYT